MKDSCSALEALTHEFLGLASVELNSLQLRFESLNALSEREIDVLVLRLVRLLQDAPGSANWSLRRARDWERGEQCLRVCA